MSTELDNQEACECCGTPLELGEDRVCNICRDSSVGGEPDVQPGEDEG
jgi:recombinational DNA repair protein RecR